MSSQTTPTHRSPTTSQSPTRGARCPFRGNFSSVSRSPAPVKTRPAALPLRIATLSLGRFLSFRPRSLAAPIKLHGPDPKAKSVVFCLVRRRLLSTGARPTPPSRRAGVGREVRSGDFSQPSSPVMPQLEPSERATPVRRRGSSGRLRLGTPGGPSDRIRPAPGRSTGVTIADPSVAHGSRGPRHVLRGGPAASADTGASPVTLPGNLGQPVCVTLQSLPTQGTGTQRPHGVSPRSISDVDQREVGSAPYRRPLPARSQRRRSSAPHR